jgi:hypothetical protein
MLNPSGRTERSAGDLEATDLTFRNGDDRPGGRRASGSRLPSDELVRLAFPKSEGLCLSPREEAAYEQRKSKDGPH